MNTHHKINYIELPAYDLSATQAFFETVFDWTFEAYGPEYLAFSDGVLDGGFYQSPLASKADTGAALVVFYSANLEASEAAVRAAGGLVNTSIFEFPGGRRFHFLEPSGNQFAVWSDHPNPPL